MSGLSREFMEKITHSLEEEEIDVYTLSIYSMSTDDLNYFNEADRARVTKILRSLAEDTRHHAELLRLIVELGEHR